MSLSNLESQLASLHSKSGLPSSKQHHESVGRGFHHSVNHGHSILTSNAKHKPSVLHPDSRSAAAADVPFTTLRENSVISLQYLLKKSSNIFDMDADALPWKTLFGRKSVNFERGLNTSETNKKFDSLIKDALFILSTSWGDATGSVNGPSLSSIPLGTNVSSSVLHVMEYLVQKYYIHVHNSEALLVAFLPHHETILFERILQLVDLSQSPHWSFLRPYSGKVGARGVPRTHIAKWAASTVDNGGGIVLINALCDVAKCAAKIHSQEMTYLSPSPKRSMEIRRGASLIISFSAATLAETLRIQSSACGTIVEPTVRCLIPFILGAVEPRRKWKKELNSKQSVTWSLGAVCDEWRSFGFILISILMKNCELSTDVCKALATGIVKGSIELDNMLRQHEQVGNQSTRKGVSAVPSLIAIESASESLLALMSILSSCNIEGTRNNEDCKTLRSPLSLVLTPDGRMDCSFASSNGSLGCGLSISTFRMLLNLDILPTALGHLSEAKRVDVRSLLASLITLCVSVVSDRKKSRNCELSMKLAISLIEESTLRSAWLEKDYYLSMAASVFFVKAFACGGGSSDDSNSLKHFAKLLHCIRATDPVGCDSGVGYAVTSISSAADSHVRAVTVERMKTLLKLSGHLKEICAPKNDAAKDSYPAVEFGNDENSPSGMITDFDRILPPRVALEHPMEDIRNEAVQRLTQEIGDMSELERTDVAHSLFRRYISDDTASVAAAAANAVRRMLSNGVISEHFYLQSSVMVDAVNGIQKWSMARQIFRHDSMIRTTRENQKKKDKKGNHAQQYLSPGKLSVSEHAVSAVCASIRISGLLAQKMIEQLLRDHQSDSLTDKELCDTIPEGLFLIVKELVLHIGIGIVANHEGDDVSSVIKETALCSLRTAVGEDDEKGTGKETVWNNRVFLGIVSRCIRDMSSAPSILGSKLKKFEEDTLARKTFMDIFLNISGMDRDHALRDRSISIQCSGALALLNGFSTHTLPNDSFLDYASKLRKCLEKCIAHYVEEGNTEKTIGLIIDLFSAPSPTAFEHISTPIIEFTGKASQGDTSSGEFTILLLETCSRPSLNTTVVERILKYADDKGLVAAEVQPNKEIIKCALITSLALLMHSELNVREGALNILNRIGLASSNKGSLDVIGNLCSFVCKPDASFRTSILLDGASALPRLLQSAVQGSDNASMLCDMLLGSCVTAVAAVKHLSLSNSHIFGIGFCNSTISVLSAMESAGESSFPLVKRWDIAGKVIFDLFLHHRNESVPSTTQKLMECVVVMLKGVTVEGNDAGKHVIITTGPSGFGRRLRSYSFGKSDGISYIESYPSSMVKSIKDCLSSSSLGKKGQLVFELCESMNRLVLSRPSWLNGIFPKLNSSTRKMITTSLLSLNTQSSMESAGVAFSELKLDALELCYLLSSIKHQASCNDSGNFVALSVLADFVRGQAESLAKDRNILDLSSCIFNQVSQLSKDGNDGSEYTRSCLLHALCSLHDQNKIFDLKETRPEQAHKNQEYSKQIGEHAKHIVSLLGAGDDDIAPLQSSKSRLTCLTLLTHLCSTFPATVVQCLLPTIADVMSTLDMGTSITIDVQLASKTKAAEETLMVIIPAFCKHAPVAGLTLLNLLSAFLGKCNVSEKSDFNTHLQLMGCLIDALISSLKANDGGVAIASVVTYFISQVSSSCAKLAISTTTNTEGSGNILALTSNLLLRVDASNQIVVALQIVQYATDMISLLDNSMPLAKRSTEEYAGFLVVSSSDLLHLATRGKKCNAKKDCATLSESEKASLMWLIKTLLEIVRSNILSVSIVKQAVRNCDNEEAEICLEIWQTLMVIQSNSSQLRNGAFSASKTKQVTYRAFLDTIEFETSASIALIQRLLPVPHFLASVSSIINDKNADHDLQKKVVSLLAERSAETDAMSAEGALFLDIVPGLVKLLNKKSGMNNESEARRVAVLQEASCKALDQLARSLALVSDKKIMQRRATVFLPALRAMTLFLHGVSHSPGDVLSSSFEHSQTLSSITLCSSTLVTLLRARCIPELPKLVKSLISLLSLVNLHTQSTIGMNNGRDQGDKLLQLSLLRTLVAVVETLPQFMVSYLKPLLTPSGLLCMSLRQHGTDDDLAVKIMAERLDNTLAVLSPSRQLIPILCTAINKCFSEQAEDESTCNEGMIVFPILKASISDSSRPDLGPVAGKIVNALIQAYGYECNVQTNFKLLETANATLVALVMKLSEAQLQQLYAKFRQWCTALDSSTASKVSALRRHSFYSLSAAMGKELRSIFLPCVSSIVGDIAKELEYASSCMCAVSKETERNKRRKLNESPVQYSLQEIRPLQPLLLFLETMFKADAHEGGKWIQNGDNERYNMLVGPLGKLLQASVSSESIILLDFDMSEKTKQASAYEILVQGVGTEEYGNVINCITSLAAAAGNEQLWKPLNHLILEACRNGRRSEVRKSGVKTLLSIIQLLGEEYMVLLPECLPVLSELLEDDGDEEIVVLAKECIRQGEALLGESLEESLR